MKFNLWVEISKAKRGGRESLERLCLHFDEIAMEAASNFYSLGPEREDLEQEARLALISGIMRLDRSRGIDAQGVRGFLRVVTRTALVNVVKTQWTAKRRGTMEELSLDGPLYGFEKTCSRKPDNDPQSLVVERQYIRELMNMAKDELTPLEAAVMIGAAFGDRDRGELADILGEDKKTIYNALFRARRKIKARLRLSR